MGPLHKGSTVHLICCPCVAIQIIIMHALSPSFNISRFFVTCSGLFDLHVSFYPIQIDRSSISIETCTTTVPHYASYLFINLPFFFP